MNGIPKLAASYKPFSISCAAYYAVKPQLPIITPLKCGLNYL